MTTEQIAAVVGAVLLCLGNLAALIKVWTDNAKVIKDRIATKLERDKDSTELHDKVLKLEFTTQQLKDSQALTAQVVDDLRDQCSTLNTNIVKLDMAVANLTEVIKELRK
jgi:hypothetical protein